MKSLDHENIDSEDPLYLTFNDVDGYIIECNSTEGNSFKSNFIEGHPVEESNGYKYSIFACTKDSRKVLRKYTKL